MMRYCLPLAAFLLGICACASGARAAQQLPASQAAVCTASCERVIDQVAADGSAMAVSPVFPKCAQGCTAQEETFLVRDAALQERVKTLHAGDIVLPQSSLQGTDRVLSGIAVKTIPISLYSRLWVLLCSVVIYWLLCILCLRKGFRKLAIGEDGRYSNSKFQMALWFGMVIVSYIATFWLRYSAGSAWGSFLGGIGIPQNLLLLSGLSAFTFGGAKAITQGKIDALQQSQPDAASPKALPTKQKASLLRDLTSNDNGMTDLGDFQMLVVTLLAVVVYATAVFHFLGSIELSQAVTLPDVDTTILAGVGLGHGAYLFKKYAGKLGES